MVEQDLVLSRALIEVFRQPDLARDLAFRGGTALHKLHLHPASRYSEDIDLVQVRAEPIGKTLDQVRAVIDPWLGTPRRKFKQGRVVLSYRFETEAIPPVPMRLKIEINSREHFSQHGLVQFPFTVRNTWFSGDAQLTTFDLDEMLGTKLRALYQRKKGRDLFDLALALDRGADPKRILLCFNRYMTAGGHTVTRALFEQNLSAKIADPVFNGDMSALLRPGLQWDVERDAERVLQELISRLPGDPWKGTEPEP